MHCSYLWYQNNAFIEVKYKDIPVTTNNRMYDPILEQDKSSGTTCKIYILNHQFWKIYNYFIHKQSVIFQLCLDLTIEYVRGDKLSKHN